LEIIISVFLYFFSRMGFTKIFGGGFLFLFVLFWFCQTSRVFKFNSCNNETTTLVTEYDSCVFSNFTEFEEQREVFYPVTLYRCVENNSYVEIQECYDGEFRNNCSETVKRIRTRECQIDNKMYVCGKDYGDVMGPYEKKTLMSLSKFDLACRVYSGMKFHVVGNCSVGDAFEEESSLVSLEFDGSMQSMPMATISRTGSLLSGDIIGSSSLSCSHHWLFYPLGLFFRRVYYYDSDGVGSCNPESEILNRTVSFYRGKCQQFSMKDKFSYRADYCYMGPEGLPQIGVFFIGLFTVLLAYFIFIVFSLIFFKITK